MGVSLLVDDLPSLPESLPDGSLLFRVALPAQEIRIISGSARPVDFGHPVDQRRLGVALLGLSWEQGGERIDAPIDSSVTQPCRQACFRRGGAKASVSGRIRLCQRPFHSAEIAYNSVSVRVWLSPPVSGTLAGTLRA